MKPFEYYSTVPLQYPRTDDFTSIFIYEKGETVWAGGAEAYKEELKRNPSIRDKTKETVIDKEKLKEARKAYGAERVRLDQEFQNDLFEEFGMTNHPKRDKVYAYAWDKGHAHGHSEVYDVFSDIAYIVMDEPYINPTPF